MTDIVFRQSIADAELAAAAELARLPAQKKVSSRLLVWGLWGVFAACTIVSGVFVLLAIAVVVGLPVMLIHERHERRAEGKPMTHAAELLLFFAMIAGYALCFILLDFLASPMGSTLVLR